jgi:hypothetical protein
VYFKKVSLKSEYINMIFIHMMCLMVSEKFCSTSDHCHFAVFEESAVSGGKRVDLSFYTSL